MIPQICSVKLLQESFKMKQIKDAFKNSGTIVLLFLHVNSYAKKLRQILNVVLPKNTKVLINRYVVLLSKPLCTNWESFGVAYFFLQLRINLQKNAKIQ